MVKTSLVKIPNDKIDAEVISIIKPNNLINLNFFIRK